jgi:hypothetical protein
MIKKIVILVMTFMITVVQLMAQKDAVHQKPLRVAIVGLVHDHVHGILSREKKGDIEIVLNLTVNWQNVIQNGMGIT